MAFGSFNDGDELRPMSEINVTPFVDVMLVLLVIFMLMMPLLMTHNLPVEMPKTDEGVVKTKLQVVTVMMDASNNIYWNDAPITHDAMKLKLSEAAQWKPQPEVRIIADQSVRYGLIASIIADVKSVGLWQLNFVTLAPKENEKQVK